MTWNLDDLFSSIESAEKFLNETLEEAKLFNKTYKNTLSTLNENEFLMVLKDYENIHQKTAKVLTYIYLQFATDAKKGNLLAKFQNIATQIEEEILFFELEFVRLEKEKQNKFIINSGKFKYFLENLQQEAKHKLSENEEKIMLKKDLTSSSAWSRFFDEYLSRVTFSFDGEKKSEEEILSMLYSNDRKTRQKAQVSLTLGLKPHIETFAYIINNIKQDLKIECEIRNYENPEDIRHESNKISKKSVDALIDTVNNNFHYVKEYYNIKKQLLNLDMLYDYDRYAPIQDTNTKYDFEKSKEVVLKTFKSFDEEFYTIAKKAFDERWIDVYPKEGKRGGAFSHPATPDVHPYVLLNHTDQRRDVFTMAHELGHAIHQYFSRDVGYINQDTPLTTAETASVFAEMLLFNELKKELPKQELIALYANKIEDIFATLFRQIVFTNFERRIHSNPENLSSQEISNIWQEENQKMFQDSVFLTNNYKSWWSYIPHFIHSPFYCYAYSYGQLLVMALFGLYKNNYPNFIQKYKEFLKAGGSKSPKELVALFGYDIEDENFWKIGMQQMQDLINEFKGLL